MANTVSEIIENWDSYDPQTQAHYVGEYGADMVRRTNIPYDDFPTSLQKELENHCPALVVGTRHEELDPFQRGYLDMAVEDELQDLSERNSSY